MKRQSLDTRSTRQILQRVERTQQVHSLYLRVLFRNGRNIMSAISDAVDELVAEAESDRNANTAILAAHASLRALLDEALANGTPAEQVAKIRQVSAEWKARNQEIVDAALAGTPADPEVIG